MHAKLKPLILLIITVPVAYLFYHNFNYIPADNRPGIKNLIDGPTIIVLAICHGIAFGVRALIVKYACRASGMSRGARPEWVSDLTVTNRPLLLKIKKGYAIIAAASFSLSVTLVGIVMLLARYLRGIEDKNFGPYLPIIWTTMGLLILNFITVFFAVHFFLTAILLEHRNRVKEIFIAFLTSVIVLLYGYYWI